MANRKKYPYKELSLDDLHGEEWEDVPGLDGYYLISNYGRIQRRMIETVDCNGYIRILQPRINRAYPTKTPNHSVKDFVYNLGCKVCIQRQLYSLSIARLVYYCFVKKFDLDNLNIVVIARDGDGRNIHPDNLALVTISRRAKRVIERNRVIWNYYTTYEEFLEQRVEKSVNPACRQISQYSKDGKRIATFPSIKAAALYLNIPEAAILSVLKGRQISSHGYTWCYGKPRSVNLKKQREQTLLKIKQERGSKVSQYDLQGKKINEYLCMADASTATGINAGEISVVCNGKQQTAGGYIWRKGWGKEQLNISGFLYGGKLRGEKRKKRIKQYSAGGEYLGTFKSIKEAGAYIGLSPSGISNALKREKLCGGYRWEYG